MKTVRAHSHKQKITRTVKQITKQDSSIKTLTDNTPKKNSLPLSLKIGVNRA